MPNLLKQIRRTIAKQVPKAGLTVSVTLAKQVVGARDPLAPASGGLPVTTISYPTRGIVSSYTLDDIDGTLILKGDRLVRLFGGLLEKLGVKPAPGDRIVLADGTTCTIIPNGSGGVATDAAEAIYLCQCRE